MVFVSLLVEESTDSFNKAVFTVLLFVMFSNFLLCFFLTTKVVIGGHSFYIYTSNNNNHVKQEGKTSVCTYSLTHRGKYERQN